MEYKEVYCKRNNRMERRIVLSKTEITDMICLQSTYYAQNEIHNTKYRRGVNGKGEENTKTNGEIVTIVNQIVEDELHLGLTNFFPERVKVVTKKHLFRKHESEWRYKCPKCGLLNMFVEDIDYDKYFLLPSSRFTLWICPDCGYMAGDREDETPGGYPFV